jgi:hypothetical protein
MRVLRRWLVVLLDRTLSASALFDVAMPTRQNGGNPLPLQRDVALTFLHCWRRNPPVTLDFGTVSGAWHAPCYFQPKTVFWRNAKCR